MNTTILKLQSSMNVSTVRTALLLIPLSLAYFAVTLPALAVDPPPDGGYPGNNTAEGTDALFNVIPSDFTGLNNTAIGNDALFSAVSGSYNTAIGSFALSN